MKLLDIYTNSKKDLGYIEDELVSSIQTDHELLNETAAHLLKAGGKRIRPLFVLLAGQFGNYDIERLKYVAVPLELIHMATLVHDDVIDDADIRRGQLTVKSKWDNKIAMYTGDYIFAKALAYSADLDHLKAHQVLSKAIVEMVIGEMEQIRFFFNTEQTIRDYLLRIRRKTALLIAVSCQMGALAAGASEYIASRLYSYGYNVGMAFQIRDDVLDIAGTEKQLGKPPGSDIRQGNVTLPFLYNLEDPELKPLIEGELRKIQFAGEADTTSTQNLLKKIKKSTGLKRAEELAKKYIDKAIHELSYLPQIKARNQLRMIARFVGERSH